MDLELMAAAPSEQERSAVDAVLGSPTSSWEGAVERMPLDGHIARGGRAARARRHLLLPALHALQDRAGWISPEGLNYVCERLTVPPAEAYGVASFYELFALEEQAPRVVRICDDVVCKAAGADEVAVGLESALGPEESGGDATWARSPCLGMCEQAPAVLYQLAGHPNWTEGGATAEDVTSALAGDRHEDSSEQRVVVPGRLLRRVGVVDPRSLDDYRAHGGYTALDRAVDFGAEEVVRHVVESRLLGRGGAAFPTGVKWEAVAAAPERPHYLICNADESEPGTFKDRVLMEGDPFAVAEAMTIAAFATGCELGYIYIRGEYPRATLRIREAIAAARAAGYLGDNVMGRGFRFEIEVRRGAGAYICGEETALMESIEGYRGEPRQKPPFPTQSGLFGKPTVINNVETLVNVAAIVLEGGAAFAATGTAESTGSRLFCLSGAVERPGVYEVEFGATLGGLLEMAGAVESDIQAMLLGGAAGSFVGPDALDLPLTFEAARDAGVSLGSGAVMVFDRSTDMASIVRRIAGFFRDESCGQCVPCRVGTVRQEEVLAAGNGVVDAALIADIAQAMADASICGLGHTAASAVQSALALGLVGESS
jgi:NADH-quinone oxidoreductase subunit F